MLEDHKVTIKLMLEDYKVTIKLRASHCKVCEHNKLKICTQCGCFIPAKVSLKGSSCPIGKW